MASNQTVIPVNERYGRLKEILFAYVDRIAAIQTANPNLTPQDSRFSSLSVPWLVDAESLTPDEKNYLERGKLDRAQLGFDGEKAKLALEEILSNDKHFRECCPTPLQLANYLDAYFLTAAANAKRQGVAVAKERLDFGFSEFESLTYHQGRFRRIAVSHPFNFDMEENDIVFEGENPVGQRSVKAIRYSHHSSDPRRIRISGVLTSTKRRELLRCLRGGSLRVERLRMARPAAGKGCVLYSGTAVFQRRSRPSRLFRAGLFTNLGRRSSAVRFVFSRGDPS